MEYHLNISGPTLGVVIALKIALDFFTYNKPQFDIVYAAILLAVGGEEMARLNPTPTDIVLASICLIGGSIWGAYIFLRKGGLWGRAEGEKDEGGKSEPGGQ